MCVCRRQSIGQIILISSEIMVKRRCAYERSLSRHEFRKKSQDQWCMLKGDCDANF